MDRKLVFYQLLCRNTVDLLNSEVNSGINLGMELYGTPIVIVVGNFQVGFAQAMVRYN